MERAGGAAVAPSTAPPTTGDEIVQHAPDGLAVIDAEARFVDANPAAAHLCGLDPDAMAGVRSPFPEPGEADGTERVGELTFAWEPGTGRRREFAYVVTRVPGRQRWIVSFRDVTLSRLRERRLAAIARAVSSVASKRLLVGTLEALAQEVARTDALAGVQVLTVNSSGDRLHVVGVAGFGRSADFFDKLMECRALGTRLMMLEALHSREQLVVPSRYDAGGRPSRRPASAEAGRTAIPGTARCTSTDPDGHEMGVYYETAWYQPEGDLTPALKNPAQAYLGRGVSVRRIDHINYLGVSPVENRDFFVDTLGAMITEQCSTTARSRAVDDVHQQGLRRRLDQGQDRHLRPLAPHLLRRRQPGRHRPGRRPRPRARRRIETGPHKHTIQQSFFLYVWEPAGNRIELDNPAARLVFAPDWQPVDWSEAERAKGQAWGLKTIDTFHTHGTPPVQAAQ